MFGVLSGKGSGLYDGGRSSCDGDLGDGSSFAEGLDPAIPSHGLLLFVSRQSLKFVDFIHL